VALASLPFVVALADLLLDFFRDAVNRGVQISFDVFGKEIRAVQAQEHGTTELFWGHAGVVVFEGDPRVNRTFVKMVEFPQSLYDVILNGFGQRDIVRRKDQFHVSVPKCNQPATKSSLSLNPDGAAKVVPILLVIRRI
jgi:hypothetical protein